jgi:hypothetical protein
MVCFQWVNRLFVSRARRLRSLDPPSYVITASAGAQAAAVSERLGITASALTTIPTS